MVGLVHGGLLEQVDRSGGGEGRGGRGGKQGKHVFHGWNLWTTSVSCG